MRIRPALVSAAFAIVVALPHALAPPSHAQYMFLDSNGDGAHTDADRLPTTGTTTVDVWLVTDRNRDGSVATCAVDPAAALTINSYEVILHATGGAVAYGEWENLVPSCTTTFGRMAYQADFYVGNGGATSLPPGLYHLGRLTVQPTSGAPNLEIAASTPIYAVGETSFGSQCLGQDQDNTMKLGRDWTDTGGLASEGASLPNAPEFVTIDTRLYLSEGTPGSLSVVATDADSDALALRAAGLPSFATFTVTESAPGRIAGRVDAAPGYADAGRHRFQVTCDDGTLSTTQDFEIVVRDVNRAPAFDPIPVVRVVSGSTIDQEIVARDPEGGPVTIEIPSASRIVTLGPTWTSDGATHVVAHIATETSDLGTHDIFLRVSDGVYTAWGTMRVLVGSPGSFESITIDSIPDFQLSEGDTVRFTVTVHDPYGNGLITSLAAKPRFAWLEFASPWNGTTATLVLAPNAYDSGEYGATVSAAEGYAYDGFALPAERSFHISVANREFPPLATTSPAQPCVQQGEVYELSLRVADPDGDPFTASFGPPPSWGISIPVSPTECRYIFSPTSEDPPQVFDLLVRTVDGAGLVTQSAVPLTLAPIGGCPRDDGWLSGPEIRSLAADAGGPYAAIAGEPVRFQGAATVDPAKTLLYYEWDFGDGAVGLGRTLRHEYRAGGSYRVILGVHVSEAANAAAFDTATVNVRDALPARAYLPPEETPIVLRASRATVMFRLERVGEEYALEDLVPSSLCLRAPGQGAVDSILAVDARAAKSVVLEDRDRNGVLERGVSFARDDIRRLLGGVRGKRTIDARLEARLPSGARVRAPIELEVLGAPPKGVAIWPNPLNPRGTITFAAERHGRAVVRLFDVNGRLVRTLLDGVVAPGEILVPFDGLDAQGRALASGVYFYRVNTADGEWRGRATILK